MNKTNKSVFMIIIYFIIISPIIIALFLILNSENKISKGIKEEEVNSTFFPKNAIFGDDLNFWSKYSGIAISKNDAVKLNDYDPKFCDNNYCYYFIPMIETGRQPHSLGIAGKYLLNNKYYLGFGYQNVPLNLSDKHFNINCVSINCSLKTIKYYSKNFLLLITNSNSQSYSFIEKLK